MYTITPLEDYDKPIDWGYSTTALTLNQVAKGILYLDQITKKLDELGDKLDSLPAKIAEKLKEALTTPNKP